MRYISAPPAARRRATAAGHVPTARPPLRHAQIIQQLCNTPPRTTWSPRLQLRLDRARSVRWPGLTVSLHADGWQVDAEVDKLEETLRAAVRPTPKSAHHHRTALGPVQSLFFFALALRGAHRRALTAYVGQSTPLAIIGQIHDLHALHVGPAVKGVLDAEMAGLEQALKVGCVIQASRTYNIVFGADGKLKTACTVLIC